MFAYLIAHRYGTPFVVASKLGLGGLVFLAGRFGVVAVHELAHGLVMASFGRPGRTRGIQAAARLPVCVRRHLAGVVRAAAAADRDQRRRTRRPTSRSAALFSLACLLQPAGAVRDICFQLAFGAYVGACFNLNPFLDRDGYHILVDVLREPALRRRAREQFARRLAGGASGGDSPVLARYSVFALAWSVVAALSVVAMTLPLPLGVRRRRRPSGSCGP